MESLNPKASSSSSPLAYPLQESERGYSFTTVHGVEYLIALVSDRELLPNEPFAHDLFSFSIVILNGRTPIGDPRVELTVIDVLTRIYAANYQTIINYVCSLEDGQERPRRMLFSRWFRQHGAGYTRLEFTDLENRIYAAALFKAGHSQQDAIEAAFNQEYRAK